MVEHDQLAAAVAKLFGLPTVELMSSSAGRLSSGSGRATEAIHLVSGTAILPGAETPTPWRVVIKRLRRPTADDHPDLGDPGHWSYWMREAIAYESGMLPAGEDGLRSVECLGVSVDEGGVDLVLAEGPTERMMPWTLDQFSRAATRLGRWQDRWLGGVPALGWLSRDQLRERILRTDAAGGLAEPDWELPALRPSFGERRHLVRGLWAQRWSLLERAASTAPTLVHGDFSQGNIASDDDGNIVVIDWATLGYGALGFDLAHLVLSASRALWPDTPPNRISESLFEAYMDGLDLGGSQDSVHTAFAVATTLTGVSRLCWTLRRTTDPTDVGYWSGLLDWLRTLSPGERK